MKYIIFLILVIISIRVFSQAKKPTLMVVPADVWCNKNDFMQEFDDGEGVKKYPNYRKAFQENSQLREVIATIGSIMQDRGFPLKDLENTLSSNQDDATILSVATSDESGAGISESPVDKLLSTARPDILLSLDYTINKTGPKKTVTFNLQGKDAYTNKQVAAAVGTGAPSMATAVSQLLQEAVISYMDHFTNSLQTYFDDMFEKGREVKITIQTWDSWEDNLNTFYGKNDDELSLLIEDWMFENVVDGRFNTTIATSTKMVFDPLRMPLYYERNGRQRALDTRTFALNLSKQLRSSYDIESKVISKGLGQAFIILGSK